MCNSSVMQGVLELVMNNCKLSENDLLQVFSCKHFKGLSALELKGPLIEFDNFSEVFRKSSFLSSLNVFSFPHIKFQSYQKLVDLFEEIANTCSNPVFFRKAGSILYANKKNSQGFDFHLKAAELGHSTTQYTVAKEFQSRKDYKEAFRWFSKAAQQGIVKSQFHLGMLYATGKGTEKNIRKAVEWMTKAAQQGFVHAQHRLSVIYRTEPGYKSEEMKMFWLEKAAQQDYSRALNDLGVSFAESNYYLDLERALELFTKAELLGSKSAKENKLRVQSRLEGIEEDSEYE